MPETAPRPDVPDDLIQIMADAEFDAPPGCSARDSYRTVLAAVVPVIERRAVEAERAAIVKNIRHYFAASDDPLFEDVKVLCGRIERGEYGASKERS